jgi:hypothetical protein
LLARYIGFYVQPEDWLIELDPPSSALLGHFPQGKAVLLQGESSIPASIAEEIARADYVVANGVLHYERDIQNYLLRLRPLMSDRARLLITYYSALWRPLMRLADWLGFRSKTPEENWLSHGDIFNLLDLADFEPLRLEHKILLPIRIPILSELVNRYLAPLPGLSALCMINVLIARPKPETRTDFPSVSVVVPARNEAGNIHPLLLRLPKMGPDDELIFIEGGSTDDTWNKILEAQQRYSGERRILAAKQDGKGKGDAVRKGFDLAGRDILMILDADLTVPPEDLPKFYQAIATRKGEFINGSRLVYPMESGAMRFLNLIANKFFALAFSYALGQGIKDTLCGTKVIRRETYAKLAARRKYFGEFDPFGDFDLIFGAARMGLKLVEVPIRYRERMYGTTNISRWRHGALLLAMLAFAARRLKFL